MKSRINKLEYKIYIYNNNDICYFKNNERHRDKDLPAIIWKDGSRGWLKNGLLHRDNSKPSRIYSNGTMHWYENGKFIRTTLNEIKNR